MAFSLPKSGGALTPLQGDGLARIETESLGFLGINGDAQVRLTSKWDPLPTPTASLLAVAHQSGWLAAAGPDSLVLAEIKSIRDAMKASPGSEDSKLRPFTPRINIEVPGRITHIAFTSDEKYLIVSSEPRGGLDVFNAQDLFNGSSMQPSFQIATNNEPLRSLAPNPAREKAELIAAVTTNGNLLVANMTTKSFEAQPGMSGSVLHANTSCVAWSTRGKQLVAGTADGLVIQMTPKGEVKAELPRSPDLQGDFYVDSLAWLENDVFFAVYVSTGAQMSSEFRLITRDSSGAKFQPAVDVNFPSNMERVPHNAVARLKDFPPSIQDILIVSSSVSPDIGVLPRAKSPLSKDSPDVIDVFAISSPRDDTRRACVPQNDDWDDTWVVGASLDLSSLEKVYQPLPEDPEVEYSPGPVPGYWVLNHEGILVGWWVIYNDSILQGTTYSGMASFSTTAAQMPSSPDAVKQQPSATRNGFGGSSSAASAFGPASSTASPFSTNSASPFVATGNKPAFGSSSGLGQSSPWGSTTTAAKTSSPFGAATSASIFSSATGAKFGQPGFGSAASGGIAFGQNSSLGGSSAPAFGQSSALGKPAAFGQTSSLGSAAAPAFGQTSTLGGSAAPGFGASKSPWASGSSIATPAFGQSGFGAAAKPFGSSDTSKLAAPTSGGFASFANAGGFSSLAPSSGSVGQSIFAQSNPGVSFKSDVSMSSSFGGAATKNSNTLNSASPFAVPPSGLSNEPFKLGTTFKRDPNDTDVDEKAQQTTGGLFGSAFGSALGDAAAETAAKEVDMDAESTPRMSVAKLTVDESTTPTTTPAPPKFTMAPAPSDGSSSSPFGGNKTQQASSVLFGSARTDDMPKQQPPSSGLLGSSTTTQTGSSPFGSTKDAKPQAVTSVFGTPMGKNEQGTSLFSQTKPSDGLTSNVKDGTPGSSIFGGTKSPSSGMFSQPAASADTTTPEKPKDSGESSGDTPLPPESTSKGTYPFGDSSSSSSESSASTTAKTKPSTEAKLLSQKIVEDAPLPPDFGTKKKVPEVAPEPAPLPPDPTKMPKMPKMPESSLPGTKPASSTEASAPSMFAKPQLPATLPTDPSVPDSLDDDEFSEAGRESEGSGVDVAKDLSPPGTITKTPGFTPQSSFGGMGGSTFSSISRPEQQSRLFGEMGKNAPVLPKPPMFTSPRSPSPVRGIPAPLPGPASITNLRNGEMRSVSAPGMASQILGNSRMRSQGPGAQASFGASITGKTVPMPNLMEPHIKARAKREAEESQILVDEDDDHIQKVLAAGIHPTTHLDEFIAHSNAESQEKDQSVASQVEAVYRDINSMIDTIGLNARSLVAFVQGHSVSSSEDGKSRQDLDDPDDWVLCEVEDLNDIVEIDLADALEEGRVREVEAKKSACTDLLRELNRLRARQDDLRKIIIATTDADMIAANRALPLSSEQSAQQAELRKEYMAFSKLLAEAEEALVLLKTRVATAAASSGRAGMGGNVPTVDAIMRTIQRMTSMAEKRSGDIDVLETQMRKLRFSSLGPHSPRSREGSPFIGTPGKGRPSSSIFSPGRSLVLSNSVRSVGSNRSTPRRKLSGYTDEEKRELMERRRSRKDVLDKVKKSLEKVGPRVVPLEE